MTKLKSTLNILLQYNTLIIFCLLLIISSMISDSFLTQRNIFNLLRQHADIGIISMGMLLVILTGGIDLSVGSMVAFTSVLTAYFVKNGIPLGFTTLSGSIPAAIIMTIFLGMLLGSVSGFLIANRRIAPFIATLAMMSIVSGFAFMVSKGYPIELDESATALQNFGSGYLLGVPYPVWLLFIVFFMILITLRYTVFGRIVIAIGSNETAVRLSGIRVGIYTFLVYTILGGLTALAGIVTTARTNIGTYSRGIGLELDVIAAVVLGGASLSGGKGTAVNTLLGVLILAMVGNIMIHMNIPIQTQKVIKGGIIILAVLLQGLQSKISEKQ